MSTSSHQWDVSSLKHMKIEDINENSPSIDNVANIIDPYEAEKYVESLKKFSIEEVGKSEWMEQHRNLEKLNVQAHQSAMSNSDEFVLEAILTFDKLDVIIHNLLVTEIWKINVYPLLVEELANKNSMRLYFILYHEATLVNLLEVLLYHKHVCESGGDKMLELVDYTARKLTKLNSGYNFRLIEPINSNSKESIQQFTDTINQRTPIEELTQHFHEIEFKVCISSVAIARFICENIDAMPLNIASRITDTHDYLILLLPLIENPPWTRRLKTGKWQKLINQKWNNVEPIDLLKVTKLEGQPWISLYHLLAKDIFRERYHINSFRKGQILRVRKYLNDTILDQLPFLADIQRFMDQLAISEVPEPNSLKSGITMFQQIPLLYENLIKNKDWDAISKYQIEKVFTMSDKDDNDIRLIANFYSDDLIESILEPSN